ncbi:GspH/FimT family pseudopilin [Halomonas sp. V046]|uniref:GspH/FimT family pseudopilin n=1 Tax=Halomonas sp. V046 TaxID=3459611 RepID=UPI0040441CA3
MARKPCVYRCARAKCLGATLLELLTVLALCAVLASVAVPGYRQLAARQDIAAELARLGGALSLARSAAMASRRPITVCPKGEGTQCGADWAGPLVIVEARGDDGYLSADRRVLRYFAASRVASVHFRQDDKPVRFLPTGRASGHNGTFDICTRQGLAASLVLSNFGRVRQSASAPACR